MNSSTLQYSMSWFSEICSEMSMVMKSPGRSLATILKSSKSMWSILTKKDESFGKFLFGVPLAHFSRLDPQEIIVVYWD